jgi:hypothetical protein
VIVPQNGKINEDDLGMNANGSGSGSADETNGMTVEVDTNPFATINYTEQIGWSTTGIYKAIRPEVLVALQPAWYWRTIGRAIDNYSFPRSLHLALNITSSKKCSLLAGMTRSEVREALEYLTMNVSLLLTKSQYSLMKHIFLLYSLLEIRYIFGTLMQACFIRKNMCSLLPW